jgi:hypothetical protein
MALLPRDDNSIRTFKRNLRAARKAIEDMESLTPDNWAEIDRGAQADLVRSAASLRVLINGAKSRYYDW